MAKRHFIFSQSKTARPCSAFLFSFPRQLGIEYFLSFHIIVNLRKEKNSCMCIKVDSILMYVNWKKDSDLQNFLVLSLSLALVTELPNLITVLPKAAVLSCARFTCDIYARFFLLLLNNKEVQKLRSKLTGYMYVQYTLDTNPSTDGQR